jgi:hypothetical protein
VIWVVRLQPPTVLLVLVAVNMATAAVPYLLRLLRRPMS